jgi:tol-pal system protein YbgF
MNRRPLLPCACMALALGMFASAVSLPARGQDVSTQERLDRLERDLNMLQRQVYRGAPAPAGEAGNAAVDTEVRMERLEEQMRELTGRVEEVMNRLQQVSRRIDQVNGDVDMRLGQAGAPGTAGAAPPPPPSAASPGGFGYPPPGPPPDEGGAAPGYPGDRMSATLGPPGASYPPADPNAPPAASAAGPAPIYGTLTPPGSPRATPQPPQIASVDPRAAGLPSGTLPSGSATEQYNYAFGLLKRADYAGAAAALKAFVTQHPDDRMAGNAQYWLGETYYSRAHYLEAASAFAEGYKRYPKNSKAADGLLKLGMSLARANQTQNACLAFTQLDHDFPNAGASIKEHAESERKRIGC